MGNTYLPRERIQRDDGAALHFLVLVCFYMGSNWKEKGSVSEYSRWRASHALLVERLPAYAGLKTTGLFGPVDRNESPAPNLVPTGKNEM